MPEALNESTVNDPKHNVAARNACIQKGFKDRLEQELAIAELEEKHLKGPKEALKKIKRDMKADTNIEGKDLDLNYQLYKRQQMAKMLEEEDANRIADNLRDVFKALSTGEMLDFVDAMEANDNSGRDNVSPMKAGA